MPLILSLKKGQDFYVGDKRVVIEDVLSETHFRVRAGEKLYDIVDSRATEVAPDVFLSAGDRPQMNLARVAIEAPRSVTILRGDVYREQRPGR